MLNILPKSSHARKKKTLPKVVRLCLVQNVSETMASANRPSDGCFTRGNFTDRHIPVSVFAASAVNSSNRVRYTYAHGKLLPRRNTLSYVSHSNQECDGSGRKAPCTRDCRFTVTCVNIQWKSHYRERRGPKVGLAD